MTMQTQRHEIDIVIPTRDRPSQLIVTLEALTRQSFRDFGVVVVDDGSRCDVEAATPPMLRDRLGIRFVRNDRSLGPAGARNRGVAHSEARYVVFIDDDCVAGPDLMRRHYETLSAAGEPVVSLGPILAVPGRRLPVWAHWDAYQLESAYAKLANHEETANWGNLFTGNVGLRRADFLAVGGFDERLMREEDKELGYRLDQHGCRFEFQPSAWVWHDTQRSLRSWFRNTASAARSDIEMQQRDPDSDRLAMVNEQLRSRHWALRLTRSVLGGPVAARCTIIAALLAAFVLHALRADGLAMNAISVVRDLTYWRTLQEALPPQRRQVRRDAIEVA